MQHSSAIPVVLMGAFTLLFSGAHADSLTTPASVMAGPDGSFSFTATFHKGPGTGQLAGYSWQGLTNVVGGISADCFCEPFCPTFAEGDSLAIRVDGTLTDAGTPGLVGESLSLCGPGGASATTVIHNYSTAGVGAQALADGRFWNEPNPFAGRTTFHYRLAEAGPVRLVIYDPAGRLVARVVDEVQPAGPHEAVWDVRGQLPGSRAAGVLFARLTQVGVVRSRALIVAH